MLRPSTGLLVILLFGCGGGATSTDASVDAPPAPVDAHVASDAGGPECGQGCSDVHWADGPTLPHRSDHHMTFIHAGATQTALLVAGGIDSDALGDFQAMYTDIFRSPIAADGTLGAWVAEAMPLPFPLGFHAQVQRGARVYLVSGVTLSGVDPAANRTVVMLSLDDSAHVEAVASCGTSPTVVHPSAALLGDRLYVIGGSAPDPVDSVWVATVDGDACPGEFVAGPALPEPRSHHTSVIFQDRLYVLGGIGTGGILVQSILRSTHDATGAISGWEVVGSMDSPPWTASGLAIDGAIWLIGGGEGAGIRQTFTPYVRRARVGASGMVQPVEAVADELPIARSHVHQTPLLDGRIYSVGGRVFDADAIASTDRVFVGTLSN